MHLSVIFKNPKLYSMKINEKISFLRESKNVSQEEIADKLGISQAAYSKIERGKSKISTEKLETIADILGVSASELIDKDCQILIGVNQDNKDTSKNVIKFISPRDENLEMLKEKLRHCEEKNRLLEEQIALYKNLFPAKGVE